MSNIETVRLPEGTGNRILTVRVEAEHREREGFQQLFHARNEVALADFLDATDDFELSDFTDGIDVVNAFLFVQIPFWTRLTLVMRRQMHYDNRARVYGSEIVAPAGNQPATVKTNLIL